MLFAIKKRVLSRTSSKHAAVRAVLRHRYIDQQHISILDLYTTRCYGFNMIFKTRHFSRWARKAALSDEALCRAVYEIRQGLVDADLGGGIIKKRVALPGQGKRGSTRTLLATNRGDRWIFIYGFEKNERANATPNELEALKLLAGDLLALTDQQIFEAVEKGLILEVSHET